MKKTLLLWVMLVIVCTPAEAQEGKNGPALAQRLKQAELVPKNNTDGESKDSEQPDWVSRVPALLQCEDATKPWWWWVEHMSVPIGVMFAILAYALQYRINSRQRKRELDESDRTRYREATQQEISFWQLCLGRPFEDRLFDMRDLFGLGESTLPPQDKTKLKDAHLLRNILISQFEEIYTLYNNPVTDFQLLGRRLRAKYLLLCLGQREFHEAWEANRGFYAPEFYEYGDMLRRLYELVHFELHKTNPSVAKSCEIEVAELYCNQIQLHTSYRVYRWKRRWAIFWNPDLSWDEKKRAFNVHKEAAHQQDAFFEALKYYHHRVLEIKPHNEIMKGLEPGKEENLYKITRILREDERLENVRLILRHELVIEFLKRLRCEQDRLRWYERPRLKYQIEKLPALADELANIWYRMANKYVAVQECALFPTGCDHTIQGDPEPNNNADVTPA